ncbi:MAG: hypothetical protein E5X65_32810 [Mesorhizobium sp.]|nr:MAG: hypothetical protein E5X65_32810 [Mesorhizobium sp.]
MTALLGFFLSNPTLIAIMASVVGAITWGFHQRLAGAKAERNKIKAKELDAYAKHLQEIQDAANARPTGGVLDDLRNRDNRT